MQQSFTAQLSGQVNGEMIEVKGGGTIDPIIGYAHGHYQLLKIPINFDPYLLSACLVTGYPNVCASNDVENPFGSLPYHYKRHISFRNGGQLVLQTHCHHKEGMLQSFFQLDGKVEVFDLTAVNPIVECWEPSHADAGIHGNFTVAWKMKNRMLCVAETKTEYHIEGKTMPLDRLLHRCMILETQCADGELILNQRSSLFSQGWVT